MVRCLLTEQQACSPGNSPAELGLVASRDSFDHNREVDSQLELLKDISAERRSNTRDFNQRHRAELPPLQPHTFGLVTTGTV